MNSQRNNNGVGGGGGRTVHNGVDYDVSPSDVDRSIDAVYDANGVRLDHTPTDDEINWLWDKVRTCLNRDQQTGAATNTTTTTTATTVASTSGSGHVHAKPVSVYAVDSPNQYNNLVRHQHNTMNGNSAQAPTSMTSSNVHVNTKYIDGSSILPQYRTQTRVGPSSGYGQAAGVPRSMGSVKKVSMDTLNTYNRRQSLLNQRRRQEGTINYHQNVAGGAQDASSATAASSAAVVQTSVHDLNATTGQKATAAVVPSSDAAIASDAANMTSTGPGIYPTATGNGKPFLSSFSFCLVDFISPFCSVAY